MTLDKRKLVVASSLVLAFLFYSLHLYTSLPAGHKAATALADRGKRLWQDYNCNACHQVYGLGGYLGPDLTNSYSTRGPEYIKAFLKNGTDIMPDFHLAEDEIIALEAYLRDVDASGKADPRTFIINKDGTIAQD
jgi:nitric oxide reductase subunit C